MSHVNSFVADKIGASAINKEYQPGLDYPMLTEWVYAATRMWHRIPSIATAVLIKIPNSRRHINIWYQSQGFDTQRGATWDVKPSSEPPALLHIASLQASVTEGS